MTPEERKNLRIVAEVMDEVELCEGCSVDTGGSGVKTVGPDGSLERLLCTPCRIKETIEQLSRENVHVGRIVVDSLSGRVPEARKSARAARKLER